MKREKKKKSKTWVWVLIILAALGMRNLNEKPAKSTAPASLSRGSGKSASQSATQPAATQPAAVKETQPKATEAKETRHAETVPETTAASGIRPDFKRAMDSYEAFYDEYCDFLADYQKNPSDLSLLGKYAGMLAKAEEADKAFAAWDEKDLTKEELSYYLDVNNRVQKKLLSLS